MILSRDSRENPRKNVCVVSDCVIIRFKVIDVTGRVFTGYRRCRARRDVREIFYRFRCVSSFIRPSSVTSLLLSITRSDIFAVFFPSDEFDERARHIQARRNYSYTSIEFLWPGDALPRCCSGRRVHRTHTFFFYISITIIGHYRSKYIIIRGMTNANIEMRRRRRRKTPVRVLKYGPGGGVVERDEAVLGGASGF